MFPNRSISLLSIFFAASLTLTPAVVSAQNYGYDNSSQFQQQQPAQGQQAYQGYQSDPGQQAFGGDPNGGYQNQQPQQQQQQQYPSQSYGGDQYGNPQGDQTYYGYAADAQRNGAQVNSQPPPQYGNQQPVYGQQGNPGQQSASNQPANLQQFLDESDKQQANKGGKQAKPKSAGPNKLVQAGSSLAKVGGNMAIGYFMGKAMQRNATNMGVPKRMTRSMPMTGMMGGLAGNPMAAAQMPMMGGGGYYPNYGYGGGYPPPPGYGGYPPPYYPGNGYGAPMGANVMTGLNNLVNQR